MSGQVLCGFLVFIALIFRGLICDKANILVRFIYSFQSYLVRRGRVVGFLMLLVYFALECSSIFCLYFTRIFCSCCSILFWYLLSRLIMYTNAVHKMNLSSCILPIIRYDPMLLLLSLLFILFMK